VSIFINAQNIKSLYNDSSETYEKKELLTNSLMDGILFINSSSVLSKNISDSKAQATLRNSTNNMSKNLAKLKELDYDLYKQIDQPFVEFKNYAKLFTAKVLSGTINKKMLQERLSYWRALKFKIIDAKKSIAKESIEKRSAFEDFLSSAMQYVLIVVLIAMAIVGGLGYVLSKSIIDSLSTLSKGLDGFFDFMNHKSSRADHIDIDSDDEIGSMAKNINRNIEQISANIISDRAVIEDATDVAKLTSSGHFDKRIQKSTQNSSLQELVSIINSMLTTLEDNISRVVRVLNNYSNNNYKDRIIKEGTQSSMKEMFDGINRLGESLTSTSQKDMQNGKVLQKDSVMLQDNVTSLTDLAKEQNSAIENTMSLLEYLIENINKNRQQTNDMTSLAEDVKSSTEVGNRLTKKTTTAMDEINSSTMAINEAITNIDQVSFQTNILSLNAAVEAATAGEAGKGFAVVAGEVRSLANRSAEAAKSIQNLVQQAQTKTDEGKNISEEMARGYEILGSNISKTIEMIDGVATSSKEQLTKIDEISIAIENLASITKKNLSIANETQSIANETSSMANTLVEETQNKEFDGKDGLR
jgi:methyl-accepting chemotaxis protein